MRSEEMRSDGEGAGFDDEKYGMSIQTPAEAMFKDRLVALFNEGRDMYPLTGQFYDDLGDILREGMEAYVAESTVITNDEQRDILYESMAAFYDDFIPELVAKIKDTTTTWITNGFEDRAFSEDRAETIVLTETRHARLPMQFITDLIQKRWEESA